MAYEAPQFDDSYGNEEHLLPQPGERPCIRVEFGGEEYWLTYDNTLVRKFGVGDGKFDHFVHHLSEEDANCYFFEDLEIGDFLRDYFETEEFVHLIAGFSMKGLLIGIDRRKIFSSIMKFPNFYLLVILDHRNYKITGGIS